MVESWVWAHEAAVCVGGPFAFVRGFTALVLSLGQALTMVASAGPWLEAVERWAILCLAPSPWSNHIYVVSPVDGRYTAGR